METYKELSEMQDEHSGRFSSTLQLAPAQATYEPGYGIRLFTFKSRHVK